MRFLIAFLFLLLIFIFPQRFYAEIDIDFLEVFHHEVGADGVTCLVSYKIKIPAWLTTEHRALIVFTEIFDNIRPEKMPFAPPNVRVYDAFFFQADGHLVINLSQDILQYGGSYFEYRLVEKLLANAHGLPDVSHFTIWIDSQIKHLPEGTKIFEAHVS